MNVRYAVPKLFLLLATFFALVGIFLFRREAIGTGLTADMYLNPLFWTTIPRLIPFTAAELSVVFGGVYFALEKHGNRTPSLPLAVVQLISYTFGILGHATLVRFWWGVLGEEHPNIPLPLWAGVLTAIGFAVCFLAFGLNIFRILSRFPAVQNNAQKISF